jgi:GT2 family glycosyltransferase
MTADLAVIVVTYNSEDYLDACLDSVDAIEGLDVEVVVVDNASTDRTVDAARKRPADNLTVVANDENVGFGRANNQGVAACDAPLVLLLNPDAELAPGAAEALVALQQDRPEHGLYGGLTRRVDGTLNEHTLRKLPSVLGTVTFGLGLSAVHPLLAVEQLDLPTETSTAPLVTGSLLLIDREVWDELGGFDERFFMYSEDADLCQRAVALGYVPLVQPDAVIIHDGGASSPDTGRKIAMMMAGRATYVRLHWTGPARWLALSALYCGVGIRAAADRLLGKEAWLTAWRHRSWWMPGYRQDASQTPPS